MVGPARRADGAENLMRDVDPPEAPADRLVAGPSHAEGHERPDDPTLQADHRGRARSPRAVDTLEARCGGRRSKPGRGRKSQGSPGRRPVLALCTKALAGPTGTTARLRPRGQTPGAAAPRPPTPPEISGGSRDDETRGGRGGETAGGRERDDESTAHPQARIKTAKGRESHGRRRDGETPRPGRENGPMASPVRVPTGSGRE